MSLEKTNIPGLLKNTKTGVVINTQDGDYARILAHREKQRKENELHSRVDSLASTVDDLKGSMEEIKLLLLKVLEK